MTMLLPPVCPDCNIGALKNLEKFRQPAKSEWLDRMRLVAFLPDPYVLPPEVKEAKKQFSKIVEDDTVIFKNTGLSPQVEETVNALYKIGKVLEFTKKPENRSAMATYNRILSHPDTEIAVRMHQRAIDDVIKGRAVPFYAVVFDALKKPEPKVNIGKLFEEALQQAKNNGIVIDKQLIQTIKTMIAEKFPEYAPKSLYVSVSDRLAKRAQQRANCSKVNKSQKKRAVQLEIEMQAKLAKHDAKVKAILAEFNQPMYKKIIKKAKNAVKTGFSNCVSGIRKIPSVLPNAKKLIAHVR